MKRAVSNSKTSLLSLTTYRVIILMIIVGVAVFWAGFFNGFVWDDFAFILNNTSVHSIHISALFGTNAFNKIGYYYRPISAVYFALLYTLFTTHAVYYHSFEIALHIANTILLYILFSRFFSKYLSLFLSLVFLVHPINVESVAFISSTVGPLSLFFGLSAVLIAAKDKLSVINYCMIGLLLSLSIFSKETGFIFCGIILLYRYLFNRKEIGKLIILVICVGVLYPIFTHFFLTGVYSKIQAIPILQASWSVKLLTTPKIIFYYLTTFFFPNQLSVDHLWLVTSPTFSNFFLPLIIDIIFFLLLAFLGVWIFRKQKKIFSQYIFFLCWFLGGGLLLLPLFALDMTVADRWFYFPIIGLLGIIGLLVHQFILPNKNFVKIILPLAVVIIVLLSIRTIFRIQDWKDQLTLFSHDSQIEDNFDIEDNYGEGYFLEGQYNAAIPHYLAATHMQPLDLTYYSLGNVAIRQKNMQLAKKYYIQALHTPGYFSYPKHQEELYASASLLLISAGTKSAQTYLQEGLKAYPTSAQLWFIYAITEYTLHHRQEALTAANRVVTLAPTSEQANQLLYRIQNNLPVNVNVN